MNPVEAALASRARVAVAGNPRSGAPNADRLERARRRALDSVGMGVIGVGLVRSLRRHLLAGETHYPDRPGMFELRRRIGAALPALCYPEQGADGVLVTASEGESLFVTLLGLGAGQGTRYAGDPPGRHQRLFEWMGLVHGAVGELEYVDAAGARRGQSGAPSPCIHAVADQLFQGLRDPDARPRPADQAIVIGSLGGLRAMRPFRLGFVAAAPETLARITKWKQASAICSPAPSQRAALWALGVRSEGS